jgi:hypothetical protein
MEKIIGSIGMILLVVTGFGLLFSLPVYLLWNGCLVGAIDGIHEVTWVQAWGLNILAGFLFKTTVNTKG